MYSIDVVMDDMKGKVPTVINVSDANIESSKRLESDKQDSSRSNASSVASNVFGAVKSDQANEEQKTNRKKKVLKSLHSIDSVFESMKAGVPSVVNIQGPQVTPIADAIVDAPSVSNSNNYDLD